MALVIRHPDVLFQVPAAVKAMYAHPLDEASSQPPVSQRLLTPGEVEELWRGEGVEQCRGEEGRRRREVAVPRPPTLTHDQDEVGGCVYYCYCYSCNGVFSVCLVDAASCALSGGE